MGIIVSFILSLLASVGINLGSELDSEVVIPQEYTFDRSMQEFRSSIINLDQCNDDILYRGNECSIVKHLEENIIFGGYPGGYNFCSYTLLNEVEDTNPLYLLANCTEYYPVDYLMDCTGAKYLGSNGCYTKEISEANYSVYDSICSCKFQKFDIPHLESGEGHSANPVRVTINEDGSLESWDSMFFNADVLRSQFTDKYYEIWEVRRQDEVKARTLSNKERAEAFFHLDYPE
jgi:hypothetical protein